MRILGLVVLAGCWTGTAPPPRPIENIARRDTTRLPSPLVAELGVWGAAGFVATTDIPLERDTAFGWRLQLTCATGDLVSVTEELRLPAPGDWGTAPELTVSEDQRVATARDRIPCGDDGWVEKTWSVSPGDPAGAWVIRVTPNGYATTTFHATFALIDH